MADLLNDNRAFLPLNMLNVFNCEGLRIKGDVSLRAERVKLSPNRIIDLLGEPSTIGVDISSPYSRKPRGLRLSYARAPLSPRYRRIHTTTRGTS
jgi:hypothetical protein